MNDNALPPALDSHTLLVAAVIVHDKTTDQVLLLQRAPGAKFAAGHWDLPVGKADRGELITATAARELKEETGLIVEPADLTIAGIIHGAWGVEAPNGFLTVVFATHAWTGEATNNEPHKHSRVAWTATDHIPTEFVSTTHTALTHYLRNGPMVFSDGF
ncbi:NUDIX domain-containing protein [Actinocorallia sp. API 0066]|uniref:NUDIX domain-containing protein n=1 Tax=Actinocorallia sp. API 0066 TaxID=2896846 RepID=UPI001E45F08A|nr:NUDIX domain-containing protein [Actinocorallia sp. API 0066]MCD0451368.1 NUDIX domain-containing protein [Actinocorallia sp. API 0066]